ncbi:MAG: DegV family protein [Clostridia bacterium]|nr:DegV family protein [Clostridia bacterium]
MNKFEIFTDSSCDLPEELLAKYGIFVQQLDVTVDGCDPVANNKLDIKEFYAELRGGKCAKTNAVSMQAFKDNMRPIIEEGKDVIYIGFSSGLSATYNNGRLALSELKEEYPERTLLYADSLAASLGQGMLVVYAAELRDKGATIQEVCDFVNNERLNICHQFTVDDLFFLKRGGRVNAATAIVGSMLGIKPVLHVDNEGHLVSVDKARGRKAAILALFNKMKATADLSEYKYVYISHGDCIDDAELLAEMIKDEYSVDEVIINNVGPVIGAHSGPGTLALFYYGTER